MSFNSDTYYGYILKGDLHGTIRYIKQFPEEGHFVRKCPFQPSSAR